MLLSFLMEPQMPYTTKPRPYKKEYRQQKARNEQPKRNARERARYAMDKKGVDRKGKDIDHVVPSFRRAVQSPLKSQT